jgi:hypothetical protein
MPPSTRISAKLLNSLQHNSFHLPQRSRAKGRGWIMNLPQKLRDINCKMVEEILSLADLKLKRWSPDIFRRLKPE